MTTPGPPVAATVVGGGPAGLMAAEVLARAGVQVVVYEHMASAGRKLALAGRSGLNVTHEEPMEAFLDRYGPHRGVLEAALRGFTPLDLRAWCGALGVATYGGTSGRVFPESFTATPLLRSWLARLHDLGVEVRVRHRWLGWARTETGEADGTRCRFEADGQEVVVGAGAVVMALGGASWPRVGSDGGWVPPFLDEGIGVAPLRPANCGVAVAWSDLFAERAAGVPIKNVALTIGERSVRGDVMVTTDGLEGGPVYAHSATIRAELDASGEAILTFDLAPDLSVDRLAERLEQRRRPKDSQATWLRRAGIRPTSTGLLREATGNDLPDEPQAMAAAIKAARVVVAGLMPIERAISTAGGIRFDEVDDHCMLRRVPGTFVAGEMLDWEAPTGGYLLQASFSTGVAAARGALRWMARGDAVSG